MVGTLPHSPSAPIGCGRTEKWPTANAVTGSIAVASAGDGDTVADLKDGASAACMTRGVTPSPRCVPRVIESMDAGAGAAWSIVTGRGGAMRDAVDSALASLVSRASVTSVAAVFVMICIISARLIGAGDSEGIVGTISTGGVGDGSEGDEGGEGGAKGFTSTGGVEGGGPLSRVRERPATIGAMTPMIGCTVWSIGVTLVVTGAMIGAMGAATVWMVVVIGETTGAMACVTGITTIAADCVTVRTGGAIALTTGITGCTTDATTDGAAGCVIVVTARATGCVTTVAGCTVTARVFATGAVRALIVDAALRVKEPVACAAGSVVVVTA